MEAYLFYIGKAALAAGTFYLAYLALFQNRKQFVFNRIYLPVSLALSFIIPLITFTTVKYIEAPAADTNSFAYLSQADVAAVTYSESISFWPHYLFGLYLLGVAGFLFHLLAGHFNAIRMVRKSRPTQLFGLRVHVTQKDIHPFSFFTKIVLSEKTLHSPNLEMIVAHENIHVKEKHTLDILFTELLFLLQWFNPFAWLLKDAVKNNLEYKTDDKIVKTNDPQTYQLAMVALADKKGVAPFLTALNGSQLKNRIVMMKKKTDNKFALLKQLIVLPLLAVLVMGLSNREVKTEVIQQKVEQHALPAEIQEEKTVKGKVTDKNGLPLNDASILVVSTQTTTTSDSDGTFEVQTAIENETLVFGKNGYETLEIKTNGKNNLDIQLETENRLYIVDGEEFHGNPDDLNPDDIKRIDVLKGESGTQHFGEKGKNGVIVITSKQFAEQNKITSELELRQFIAKNIKYPVEAQEANKTGIVQLFIELNNSGQVEKILEKASGDELFLDEVVVVGYKNKDDVIIKNTLTDTENSVLKNEVERIIRQLPKIEIPEYKGKTVGITVKFVLK